MNNFLSDLYKRTWNEDEVETVLSSPKIRRIITFSMTSGNPNRVLEILSDPQTKRLIALGKSDELLTKLLKENAKIKASKYKLIFAVLLLGFEEASSAILLGLIVIALLKSCL